MSTGFSGADVTSNFKQKDPVVAILELTKGRMGIQKKTDTDSTLSDLSKLKTL